MKKLLALILTMALITTTGCDSSDPGTSNSGNLGNLGNSLVNSGSPGGFNPNSNNQANSTGGNSGINAQTENTLTLLCEGHPRTLYPSGCSTADGYYSMEQYLSSSDDHRRITYIDYASGQEVILCSDSSCNHNSERCSSFVTGSFLESELFFWEGHLYYFEASYDQEGGFSSGGWTGPDGEPGYSTVWVTPAKLYRMNPDGTNRELVYAFPENLTVELTVVGDKNGLWFIQKETVLERDEKTGASHIGAKNKALVKLDLSEKKIVEQIPVPSNDNITKDFIGVCGSKFIFDGIAYPDGKSAMDYIDILAPRPTMAEEIAHMDEWLAFHAKCDRVFFALDISDKTLKEFFRINYAEVGRGQELVGDKLYITRDDETAFSLDLTSEKIEEFPVPDGYRFEGFIGERPLYMMTGEPYKRILIDPKTEKTIPWILHSENDVVTICGDFALVISEEIGTPTPSGGLRNPYNQYSLIPLDDLYNGRANFKKVDMLERYNK